jgi:hypothetical protein
VCTAPHPESPARRWRHILIPEISIFASKLLNILSDYADKKMDAVVCQRPA